jgi:hypothetical protein
MFRLNGELSEGRGVTDMSEQMLAWLVWVDKHNSRALYLVGAKTERSARRRAAIQAGGKPAKSVESKPLQWPLASQLHQWIDKP